MISSFSSHISVFLCRHNEYGWPVRPYINVYHGYTGTDGLGIERKRAPHQTDRPPPEPSESSQGLAIGTHSSAPPPFLARTIEGMVVVCTSRTGIDRTDHIRKLDGE